MFVIPIIAVVVSIEDPQCCMLGMKVHMFKLSSCISPRQYKTVFFPCYLCNMCSLLVISGKSGLHELESELSGTRIVGFYNFSVFFGYQFLKPEFQKTRKTRPEIFGLPERPPIGSGSAIGFCLAIVIHAAAYPPEDALNVGGWSHYGLIPQPR